MYKCSPGKKDKRKKSGWDNARIFKFCEKNMNLDQEVQPTKHKRLRRKTSQGRQLSCISHISVFFLSKDAVGLSSELDFKRFLSKRDGWCGKGKEGASGWGNKCTPVTDSCPMYGKNHHNIIT